MKKTIQTAAPLLLLVLFAYAGLSKFFSLSDFRGELHNQSFPGWMAEILLYTLIPIELLTAGLLAFERTERWGLWLSLFLMSAFTGYIVLVLLNFWKRVPCSCGGILKQMSWGAHLVFNVIFLLLALAALLFSEKAEHTYST
ncbi:MauE/DoxX family redox-associated membrane protein [Mucilaginibacter phyllosphaerae]